MAVTVAEDWQPVVADDAASPFRRRLLDGLAASISERGYRDTTVADIVRHARTSKRTFYGAVLQQGGVLHRTAARPTTRR